MRRWTSTLKPPAKTQETMYISFDGAAVPMRKRCLRGRRGRTPGVPAKTREVRLGCVFTQSAVDPQGQPVRDPHSTTYTAAVLDSRLFGRVVRAEALRRGMRNARRLVVITDGAKWCETVLSMNFPGALHILDFYHAAEHLQQLATALLGERRDATVRFRLWRRALLRGKAPELIQQARDLLPQARDAAAARREIGYLDHNLPRMQYAQFKAQGLFIGSGVIEAGCKTVIAQRTKLSGMLWTIRGVQDILTLRCHLLGGQLDRFWDHSFAQRLAS